MNTRFLSRRLRMPVFVICAVVIVFSLYSRVAASSSAENPHTDIYFLDVGQSESILITSGRDAVLIDGGTTAMGDRVVKDLKELGIKHLSAVIATHPHHDHVGGLPAVLKAFPVDKIYMSDSRISTKTFRKFIVAAQNTGVPIIYPDIGDVITLSGGTTLKCIAPGLNAKARYKDGYVNTWSLVFRLDAYDHSVLLTADTTKVSEREMLERGEDIKCDVLKVAHHGDDTSSTDEFIEQAAPTYGVISYGSDNPYGVPKKSVRRALEQNDVEILTTPEYGTIKLEISKQCLKFTGSKVDEPLATEG